MRETVDLISVDDDIDTFVSTFKTGANKPTRVVYQNFFETNPSGKSSNQRLSSRFYGSLRGNQDANLENGGNSLRGTVGRALNKDALDKNKTLSHVSLTSPTQNNYADSLQSPSVASTMSSGSPVTLSNDTNFAKSPLSSPYSMTSPSSISRRSPIGTLKEIKEMNADATNSSENYSPSISNVPIVPARSISSLHNNDEGENSLTRKTSSKILQSIKADTKQFVMSNELLAQKISRKPSKLGDQEDIRGGHTQSNKEPSKLNKSTSDMSKIDDTNNTLNSSDNQQITLVDPSSEKILSKSEDAAVPKPEKIQTTSISSSSSTQKSNLSTAADSGFVSASGSPLAVKNASESSIVSPPIQSSDPITSSPTINANISLLTSKKDSVAEDVTSIGPSRANENVCVVL